MHTLGQLYDSLRGTRVNRYGQLIIEGFRDEDYEDLYELLLSEVVAPRIPEGVDYYLWLRDKAESYHQHRIKHQFYERVDYLVAIPPHELDTRQQLAILKFYIYRRFYSRHKAKGRR